jgi:hypothetical protein
MSTDGPGRDESLQLISAAYRDFLALLDSIPEADMLEPNTVGSWSGKDVVADIAGWERAVLRVIEARDRGWLGYSPPAEADGTWDRFNQSNVDPTRDWSLDEVKAHFAKTHHTLMRVATNSEHTTWASVVRLTKTHYEEHYDDLQNIPEIVAGRKATVQA